MVDSGLPTEDDVIGWAKSLSNWGRWGPDDELGTLNHLSPDRRVRAAGEIRTGRTVSCAWDIDPEPAIDHVHGAPLRHMLGTGETDDPAQRWAGASEWIGLAFHGYSVTHLDSLAHYFWDGFMYNGRPASQVTVSDGAREHAVTAAADGISGRGVLIDLPALQKREWLEPGEFALPVDLDAAERRQGVRVGPGDIVLLRTGYGARRRSRGPDDTGRVGRAGWHVACLPWLHARDVAAIGADTAQDVHPSGYAGIRSPMHAIGIVALGLWLIDNCDLEALAKTCAALDRWSFHLSVLPLRLSGVTGSPVNPVATF